MDDVLKLMAKYPNRVPILITCKGARLDAELKKRKYLVPCSMMVSEFMLKLHACLPPRKSRALFLYTAHNSALLCGTQTIGALYNHNNEVLNLVLCEENTFVAVVYCLVCRTSITLRFLFGQLYISVEVGIVNVRPAVERIGAPAAALEQEAVQEAPTTTRIQATSDDVCSVCTILPNDVSDIEDADEYAANHDSDAVYSESDAAESESEGAESDSDAVESETDAYESESDAADDESAYSTDTEYQEDNPTEVEIEGYRLETDRPPIVLSDDEIGAANVRRIIRRASGKWTLLTNVFLSNTSEYAKIRKMNDRGLVGNENTRGILLSKRMNRLIIRYNK